EASFQSENQSLHRFKRKEGGCAAAEEDGLGLRGLIPQRCFLQNKIDKPVHPFGCLSSDGIEIAVMAFMKTKRNMHVERIDPCQRNIARRKLHDGLSIWRWFNG